MSGQDLTTHLLLSMALGLACGVGLYALNGNFLPGLIGGTAGSLARTGWSMWKAKKGEQA